MQLLKIKRRLSLIANAYLNFKFSKLQGTTLAELGWRYGGVRQLDSTARGYCDVNTSTIYLGNILLKDDSIDREQIKEIILHEISHAVDSMIRGYTTHDMIYKRVCNSIGKDTGVSGYMIYSDNQSLGNINAYEKIMQQNWGVK